MHNIIKYEVGEQFVTPYGGRICLNRVHNSTDSKQAFCGEGHGNETGRQRILPHK